LIPGKIGYELPFLTKLLYFFVGRLWGTTLKQAREKMPTPRRRNSPLIAIACQDEEFFTLENDGSNIPGEGIESVVSALCGVFVWG